MIANLCGGDVASTMKEWQTSTYRVDYGYCSATVGYDVLARFNSTMEKIPAAAKEELVVDDAGHPFCSIWASTPFDSEAVCIVEIGINSKPKKEMDVFFIKDVHLFFRLGIETYFADSPS